MLVHIFFKLTILSSYVLEITGKVDHPLGYNYHAYIYRNESPLKFFVTHIILFILCYSYYRFSFNPWLFILPLLIGFCTFKLEISLSFLSRYSNLIHLSQYHSRSYIVPLFQLLGVSSAPESRTTHDLILI